MLQKISRLFLIVSAATAGGCASGHPLLLETCVVDVPHSNLGCTLKDKSSKKRKFEEVNKYVCFPQDDAKLILEELHSR